jgi:hypothetical protein
VQFLVNLQKANFQIPGLPDIEPIFCSLAVWDLAAKKKISENFYFDFNLPAVRDKLGQWKEKEDSSASKKALFTISQPHADCYLVLRVEKVLQGDPEECTEPYLKVEKVREKDTEKHRLRFTDVADVRSSLCWLWLCCLLTTSAGPVPQVWRLSPDVRMGILASVRRARCPAHQ